MAGFYTNLYKSGNTSGQHAFDADIVSSLVKDAGVVAEKVADDANGERVKLAIADKEAQALIHFNGKQTKDETRDTLLMSIGELAKLPDDVQEKLFHYEQTPDGRREGVTKPPRDIKAEAEAEVKLG